MRSALDLGSLNTDNTTHTAAGDVADVSNMRRRLGYWQTISGWEAAFSDALGGVCRSIFPWSDNNGATNLAFGTHATLEVYRDGVLADITPTGLVAGQIDGTGGSGYGTGAYGVGDYGEPSLAENFPRTWSLSAWGQNLIANPRRGEIYVWTNDTSTPAAQLTNAPEDVVFTLVSSQDQVFALGCSEEVSGDFNPLCIRHSSVRDNTEWNTASNTTAREYILPGGGYIVAGRVFGPHLLVWTNSALFLGQYTGSLEQPWRFDKVGDHCGLIGPLAAVVVGNTAYWVSPDRQFRAYTIGGTVANMACPIRTAFADNLAAVQGDKVHASSVGEHGEVWFYYPDQRDGLECSRYLSACVDGPDAGEWSRGIMARTASVDAGPTTYPCRATYDGQVYFHERGSSADGGLLEYHVETADYLIDENAAMMVREARPDIADQVGPVNLTLTSRFEPQSSERVDGPYALSPAQSKQSLRSTGRYFKIKFAGSSAPAHARIGRIVFDVTPAGRR